MHPGPVMHFSLPHLFLFFLVLVVCHGCERSRQCVTRATCTPRFVGLYIPVHGRTELHRSMGVGVRERGKRVPELTSKVLPPDPPPAGS